MTSLPLGDTAILSPRVGTHLCIAFQGEVQLVFPRSLPYILVKRIADAIPNSEIRLIDVRSTYEVLESNEIYDTSASV